MNAVKAGQPLTPRELEVLQLIGCGLTTRQIGERMWLSYRTVETHALRVRVKLDVHHITDAVRIALDTGLIPVRVSHADDAYQRWLAELPELDGRTR